jgi:hypothetical protein
LLLKSLEWKAPAAAVLLARPGLPGVCCAFTVLADKQTGRRNAKKIQHFSKAVFMKQVLAGMRYVQKSCRQHTMPADLVSIGIAFGSGGLACTTIQSRLHHYS